MFNPRAGKFAILPLAFCSEHCCLSRIVDTFAFLFSCRTFLLARYAVVLGVSVSDSDAEGVLSLAETSCCRTFLLQYLAGPLTAVWVRAPTETVERRLCGEDQPHSVVGDNVLASDCLAGNVMG